MNCVPGTARCARAPGCGGRSSPTRASCCSLWCHGFRSARSSFATPTAALPSTGSWWRSGAAARSPVRCSPPSGIPGYRCAWRSCSECSGLPRTARRCRSATGDPGAGGPHLRRRRRAHGHLVGDRARASHPAGRALTGQRLGLHGNVGADAARLRGCRPAGRRLRRALGARGRERAWRV